MPPQARSLHLAAQGWLTTPPSDAAEVHTRFVEKAILAPWGFNYRIDCSTPKAKRSTATACRWACG
jgi:uncharacterized protein YcaQ